MCKSTAAYKPRRALYINLNPSCHPERSEGSLPSFATVENPASENPVSENRTQINNKE